MEDVRLGPWIGASIVAVVLSTLWGIFVRQCLTPKDERGWRGFMLGPSEGIIFMVTFAGVAAIGAAWLGFKVASKWKSWSLMADARRDAENPVKDKEIDMQYHRFLVGTAGNIVIGLIAAAVAINSGGSVFR